MISPCHAVNGSSAAFERYLASIESALPPSANGAGMLARLAEHRAQLTSASAEFTEAQFRLCAVARDHVALLAEVVATLEALPDWLGRSGQLYHLAGLEEETAAAAEELGPSGRGGSGTSPGTRVRH